MAFSFQRRKSKSSQPQPKSSLFRMSNNSEKKRPSVTVVRDEEEISSKAPFADLVDLSLPDGSHFDAISDVTSSVTFSLPASSYQSIDSRRVQRKSSTSIIKPRSDSIRSSLERAHSALTMNHLRFKESSLYGRER
jgi:hypothetical protein